MVKNILKGLDMVLTSGLQLHIENFRKILRSVPLVDPDKPYWQRYDIFSVQNFTPHGFPQGVSKSASGGFLECLKGFPMFQLA